MLDSLLFEDVEGSVKNPRLTVYALSTCGFCKRGLAWLNSRSFAYRFVYLDLIPLETKNSVKTILFEKYRQPVSFPYVVIDDATVLIGFVESDWKKALGVE